VLLYSESLINLNLDILPIGRFNTAEGDTFFGEIISVYSTNKPGQFYQPPMPPPPVPLPAPPLFPNSEFFPGMDIDEDMEDDMFWDNEELNDDSNPVAEC
jgi:hypothetical protein